MVRDSRSYGSARPDRAPQRLGDECAIVDPQRVGGTGNPIRAGHPRRRSPQRLGDARRDLTGPPPTLESPPGPLQAGGQAACLSRTHGLSSTSSRADNPRYHTAENPSHTLAGRTRLVRGPRRRNALRLQGVGSNPIRLATVVANRISGGSIRIGTSTQASNPARRLAPLTGVARTFGRLTRQSKEHPQAAVRRSCQSRGVVVTGPGVRPRRDQSVSPQASSLGVRCR
jgi:hypothetical protein